jgi:light-independent protochlorophyllide reductase subunit B
VTANLIGPTALGFRHRDDITEVTGLLYDMGIGSTSVRPFDATPRTCPLGAAHFNVLMYPETAETAARTWSGPSAIPYTKVVPIGVGATRDFVAEVAESPASTAEKGPLNPACAMPWWSASSTAPT